MHVIYACGVCMYRYINSYVYLTRLYYMEQVLVLGGLLPSLQRSLDDERRAVTTPPNDAFAITIPITYVLDLAY